MGKELRREHQLKVNREDVNKAKLNMMKIVGGFKSKRKKSPC